MLQLKGQRQYQLNAVKVDWAAELPPLKSGIAPQEIAREWKSSLETMLNEGRDFATSAPTSVDIALTIRAFDADPKVKDAVIAAKYEILDAKTGKPLFVSEVASSASDNTFVTISRENRILGALIKTNLRHFQEVLRSEKTNSLRAAK